MVDDAALWDFYWEVRLREMEDLGKREAILAASKLIRGLAEEAGQPVRMLELGCGEGQIIGELLEAHAQVFSINASVGVDYNRQSIETCRRTYPGMRFIEGDFTAEALLSHLGQFEIVMLVNALHEVFSASFSSEFGEVDVLAGKQQVRLALADAVSHIAAGGYLVLFDGLETSGDIQENMRIRFQDWSARQRFETFVREYQPFKIIVRETGDADCVEISRRDFTRYIDKSIFLDKPLWQTERLESYQYFNETEFLDALTGLGLTIRELRTLTVNYEKWRSEVEILTPGVDFPAEHILIVAQK
jgi:SAM-dependent methyltransferase